MENLTTQDNDRTEIIPQRGYYPIIARARFKNISLTPESVRELDLMATRICEERFIPIGSIQHPEFGLTHLYPLSIIDEVLDRKFA